MIKKDITNEEVLNRLELFLKVNKNNFSEEEKEILRKKIFWTKNSSLTIEILRQVSDELDILSEETNIYNGFAKLVQDNFNINRTIVEVASGKLPRLALKLVGLQTSGEVIVYDPLLINKDYKEKKLVLKQEKLTKETIVPKDSLIVSFMPCESTLDVLEYATNNKLDFIVALCGCNHYYSPYANYDDTLRDWYANVEYIARRGIEDNNLGEFKKTYMKEFNNPYPILYNKRKK